MTEIAITNIGELVTGRLDESALQADTILARDGRITEIGRSASVDTSKADIVVDCRGSTVIPGLIDSHVHTVIGDFTPRQRSLDFWDTYVHGGITSIVSAGELHTAGRTHDPILVKSLAITARKCFENFRPTGMKVNAGAVILEPTLTEADLAELAAHGIRHAKFGFGAYDDPVDGEPQVRWARQHGIVVQAHSGPASIPGSATISAAVLLKLHPNVCAHINGGSTALPDRDVERLVRESDMGLQLVQIGNLRSALHALEIAAEVNAFDRIVLASDTPSGPGLIPVAVIKTICELASLGGISATQAIAFGTGNNAHHFRLDTGTIEVGKPADLLVIDVPVASAASSALEAIEIGDVPGISMVIIDGIPRVGKSRNTPAASRLATAVDRRGDQLTFPGGFYGI